MLDNKLSTDFKKARYLAEKLKLNFVPVFLPKCYDQIIDDLAILVRFGAKLKTDFECCWPLLYVYKVAKERVLFSGVAADGHFCISKKGMIHYKNRIDEFRKKLFSSSTYAQKTIHNNIADFYNKVHIAPYRSQDMVNQFLGTTWEQVNKPNQKQPILNAYKDKWKLTLGIGKHQNLQLGDSGIADHLSGLVKTKYNCGNYKSVTGIYNSLVRKIKK